LIDLTSLKRFVSPFNRNKIPILLYAGLLSGATSIIFAGNVLGFAKIYNRPLAITTTIFIFTAALYYYLSKAPSDYWDQLVPKIQTNSQLKKTLDGVFLFVGAGLFALLVLFPLITWPRSYITKTLPYDAALYHFPKAVNLYQTQSAWEHSTIAYWEYPSGYENLLSFGLLLTGDENLFGTIHAFIASFLILSLWLLGRRYTRLPNGLLFFTITTILMGKYFIFLLEPYEDITLIKNIIREWIVLNPWWDFSRGFKGVGKNDLLITAVTLGMILHSPVRSKKDPPGFHIVGLAMNTMLAFSIKPNGALMAIPIWLITGYAVFERKGVTPLKNQLRRLILALIIIAPGLTWAVRNFILQGRLFSISVLNLAEKSLANYIIYMFTNNATPRTFDFVIGILLLGLVFWLWARRPSGSILLTLFFSALVFLYTPGSGFQKGIGAYITVNWRFGIVLLCYCLIICVMVIEPILAKAISFLAQSRLATAIVILGVVSFGITPFYNNPRLLETDPNRSIVVKDYFIEPVGVDGYYSIYDYIHRNIRGAAIRIDNGLPYYAYGPDYSNFPTVAPFGLWYEDGTPLLIDNYVVFKSPDDDEYPEILERKEFLSNWVLIYEDNQGRIYQATEMPDSE